MSLKTANKPNTSVKKSHSDALGSAIWTVDEVIAYLLHTIKSKSISSSSSAPHSSHYHLRELDILNVIHQARILIASQPMLIETEGSMRIVGDIHGQFSDLVYLLSICGDPSTTRYLFLGDYVDRGKHGIETILLLMCYKIKYPRSFYLLRGNHESQSVSRVYGFFDECKRRYSVKLWKSFVDVFNFLPIAAILENQIFCCHGGLSPDMMKSDVNNLEQFKSIFKSIIRPVDIPDNGLICDVLWSDPFDLPISFIGSEFQNEFLSSNGFAPNERGISYVFSPKVVDNFLSKFSLDLIIRAHQVVEDGYEFFANRSFVTIFSAPNYCGEFDNAGAVFCLTRSATLNNQTMEEEIDLEGSFRIIFPENKRKHSITTSKKVKS